MHAVITLAGHDLGEYMASIKMIFAGNLRRLLRERDVKAKELARLLGVSPSIVTHWRNADRFPTPENIEKICETLRVPYAELFREGVEPNPGEMPDAESTLKALAKALRYEIKKTPTDD